MLNAIISLAAVADTLTVELAGSTLEPLSAILTESVAKGGTSPTVDPHSQQSLLTPNPSVYGI